MGANKINKRVRKTAEEMKEFKGTKGEYILVRKDLTRGNHEEEICRFTNKDWARVGRNLFDDELGGKYNDFFIRHEPDRSNL